MHTNVKLYGNIIEITQYEKKFNKVRVHASYERSGIFGARRIDNLRRTRSSCMRRLSTAIEELGSPLLVTLTLSERSTCAQYASDSLSAFFRRLRVKFPESHALFVPEVSPRGRIHFHGLVFGLPQSMGDFKKGGRTVSFGSERRDREIAKCWVKGFVDCRATDGSPKLAYYLTKYILKHGNDTSGFSVLLNGLRMVRATVGFPKETVLFDNTYFNEFVLPKYAGLVPLSEWSARTSFTGLIVKKKYILK